MQPNSKRFLFVVFLLGCFAALAIHTFVILKYATDPAADFVQDYNAAQALLKQQSIYDVPNDHPPLSALLATPLVRLPYAEAFLLFSIFSDILYFLSLLFLVRALQLPLYLVPVFLSFALSSPQHIASLSLGALSSIVSALVILSWCFYRKKSDVLSGVFLSLATALKLYPGLIVLSFLLSKRWRAVGGFVVTGVLIFLLFVFLLPQGELGRFLFQITPENFMEYKDFRGNLSLLGSVERFFGDQGGWVSPVVDLSPVVSLVIGWGVVGGIFFYSLRLMQHFSHKDENETAFLIASVSMILLSPISWGHYLTVLVLPIGVVFSRLLLSPTRSYDRAFLVVLFLVSGLTGHIDDAISDAPRQSLLPWYHTGGYLLTTVGVFGLLLLLSRLKLSRLKERRSH